MAIASGQSLLLHRLAEIGAWRGIRTVCELGSQVPIRDELAEDLFASCDKPPLTGRYSARDFYEHLGAISYTNIDFNGLDGSLVFDLNRNLRAEYDYYETFDLVTNYGTSPGVFNQFEVFRNIHQLCETGGYMLHTLPTQGWGRQYFFRYDTNFVEDLAAANDYEVLFLESFLRLKPWLKNQPADSLGQIRTLCDFVESRIALADPSQAGVQSVDLDAQRDLEGLNDVQRALSGVGKGNALFNITLACLLRKTSGNDFATPILRLYQVHVR